MHGHCTFELMPSHWQFPLGSAGGRAAPHHCDGTNDPWFFRCDQQTKLSSRSITKGVTRGKELQKPPRLRGELAAFRANASLTGVKH